MSIRILNKTLPCIQFCKCISSSSGTIPPLPESELDPENEKRKSVRDLRLLNNASRAVYAVGLTKTGSFAIPSLIKNLTSPEIVARPLRIATLNFKKIKRIAAGFGFSLFASSKELYGSGLNNYYQIGGPRSEENQRTEAYYISTRQIPLPIDAGNIIDVSAGRLHSLIATSKGVYAFGDNAHGQCGQDPEAQPFVTHNRHGQITPVLIPSDSPVIKVHCSLDTSFVLLESGELYAFGLSTDGQLGNGCKTIEWQPTLVKGDLENEKIVQISGSTDTITAVSRNGNLFLWGQNEYGQLKILTNEPQIFYPHHYPINLGKVVSVGSTGSSCIVSNQKGEVYTWGSQILGFGPAIMEMPKPMLLDPPLFSTASGQDAYVQKVFAGNTVMGALTKNGNLYTWGSNRFGGLGLNHTKDQFFPYQVYLPNSVKTVSFGPDHSLFVTG